jgi:hypothetical protein
MAAFRGGQRSDPHDDVPADAVVRPTTGDDALGRSASAPVVVIADETGSITRYVSWLADTYETQTVRRREAIPFRPGTEVVVVDHRTLTMAGERARGPIGRRRGSCRVLAPVVLTPCDGLIDGYIAEPVGRDGPLGRVETAMRMATYDASIAEPVSLTMWRRRLRNRAATGCADHGSDIARLSERIDTLHRRTDDELSGVESRYATLLGRERRPSPRRATDQSARDAFRPFTTCWSGCTQSRCCCRSGCCSRCSDRPTAGTTPRPPGAGIAHHANGAEMSFSNVSRRKRTPNGEPGRPVAPFSHG